MGTSTWHNIGYKQICNFRVRALEKTQYASILYVRLKKKKNQFKQQSKFDKSLMKVYNPPQQSVWGTPAHTCCFGQCLDSAEYIVFPAVSHTESLHPQGTSISGSQQANKIQRRSAGHCRIILSCQPRHSAEYMLNPAAGQPSISPQA